MDTSDSDREEECVPLKEITGWQESDEPTLMPCEDQMNTLNLGTEENRKELNLVDSEESEDMIQLLREFMNVFLQSYDDMPGLDPQIVTHKIPLILGLMGKAETNENGSWHATKVQR